MIKKFELVKENPLVLSSGRTFYRIRALRNSINFKKGDIGGYVGRENCLSQEGNSWIYDNSIVCKGCQVKDEAIVKGNSIIDSNTTVRDFSIVLDNSEINNSSISGRSVVNRYSKINGAVIINSAITESNVDNLLIENSTLERSDVLINQFSKDYDPAYSTNRVINSYLSLFVYDHLSEININEAVMYSVISDKIITYKTKPLNCNFYRLLNMEYAKSYLGIKYNHVNDTYINNSLRITWIPNTDMIYVGNELIGCKFRSSRKRFLEMLSANNTSLCLYDKGAISGLDYIKSELKNWDGFFDMSLE